MGYAPNPTGANGPRPVTEFQFPAVAAANATKPTPLGGGQSAFQKVGDQQAAAPGASAPAFTPRQPAAAEPAAAIAPSGADGGPFSGPSGNIISWNGTQMDSSVLQYAQTLSGMGLSLSSGYRDPAHNASVGGVPNSWHLTGRALDFSGSSQAMQQGAAWARSNGANEVLIHNAGSGMHLHVAW